ncbi:MAG TPA: AMP-binding protein [Nocardioidaceae bacterium]|nr:AMP-binding protein [Nocardioidaceae bacterium]
MASLRPVSGPPRAIHAALRGWLAEPSPRPLVVRTSGSTGTPKDVVLGRDAMLASARATLDRLGGPGRWLLALPAHHVAGLQVLVRSLVGGTTPVLLDEYADLDAAVAAIPDGPRYVSLVPTQLQRLLDERAGALRAFDAVLLGGAPAAPALLDRARRAGIRVVTTYGMSETCGGCVYDGRPLDGVEVTVDHDGRVLIGGAVLFDGYAGRPELTAQTLVGGVLRTPDLGAFDADGRLRVTGRVDDVVVSGGVNVGLAAVEQRVREQPQVKDAAVVGADDAEWGTRVVAYVVADAGLTLDMLRDFVADTLPRTWAPRELVVVPDLPLLDNGKVDRRALRSGV